LTVNPKECFPDKVIRLEISQLLIVCQNHDLGCPWIGELKELFAHLYYCEYTNKIKCKLCLECVHVSYLNQHEKEECPERETGCDHCGTQVIAKDLKAHYGSCVSFPVPCVNCQKMVLRINLRKHEEGCTHTQNKDLRHLNTLLVGLVIKWLVSLENKFKRLEGKTLQVEDATNSLGSYLGKLELEFLASLTSTYNGIYIWKIADVRRKFREAKLGRIISISSSPFYTSKTGYKMCVRCYLNGDGLGEGQYLSLSFVIMKGEYDALLLWPFDGKVSLMLIDQDRNKHIVQTFKPNSSSSSFTRPKTDMNVASGCPQFASLEVLSNKSYVKDDILFIKCIIDTDKMVHP
jgi:TNF receptor-associated factor 2/TNF receptor-associated factor 3